MCGRFALTTPAPLLAELFDLDTVPQLPLRYNIAPTQPVAVVRLAPGSDRRELVALRWGLVPSWADDPGIGTRLLNARCETVANKPAFRSAFRHRRCLIPADGFYEWSQANGTKTPYYIHRCDGQPLVMAGLWEHRQAPDGTAWETCAILTTAANDVIQPLHSRMPALVEPADFARWLAPQPLRPQELLNGCQLGARVALTFFPVSTYVNSPRHDDARCRERLPLGLFGGAGVHLDDQA